jgi:hypothetical protein
MCEARAHYESAPPPRTSTSAPTPEAISVRVATKVSGPPSGGPPVVGSALAVAVALAVALAVAVALALAVGLAMALALAVGLAMALALAVGLAMALALAVGLAFMAEPYFWAKAAEANSRTSTALTLNTSKTFFIQHLP